MSGNMARNEFETWIKNRHPKIRLDRDGDRYKDRVVDGVWSMWSYAYLLGTEDGAIAADENRGRSGAG